MKKFFAVAGASLLNGFYFILGWILLLGGFRNTFLFYVTPVLSAVTFLFLGSLFYRHLRPGTAVVLHESAGGGSRLDGAVPAFP